MKWKVWAMEDGEWFYMTTVFANDKEHALTIMSEMTGFDKGYFKVEEVR